MSTDPLSGTQLEISDAEAEVINPEIVAEVQMLAPNPSVQQHQEVIKLLNDIKVELNPPTPAAVKFKMQLPPIIPGVSGEIELDIEALLRRIWSMIPKPGSKQKKDRPGRGQATIPQRSKQLFGATKIHQVREWIGRDELLSELVRDFANGRKVTILHGQGGMGKTSLAVKLIEARGVDLESAILPPTCPYDNALYCAVEKIEKDGFDSLAQTFLSALGLAEHRAGATAEEIIEMILTKFHREQWLVIIDNLETLLKPESCRAISPDVGKLLYELAYGNHKSQIVITSRKVPADLEERRGNQIDRSIIRIQPVEGISKADSVVLLEDLGAEDNQEDLHWIADRVGGNILVLRLLADYSKNYPGKLRKQPELVTDKAEPIVQLQFKAQSSAAQNLLKRMCVLRIGMDAKALTILRLFLPTKNPFSRKKAAQKQTEALLNALVNSALVEKTYNSSTRESEYKLHRLIAETLQEIFAAERNQLWLYAAKLYDSFKPPKELRSLADWKFGLEKLYFWWEFGNQDKVIRIVINSLLPSLGRWSNWGLQQEWCVRILDYTKDSDRRYCLRTLGYICRDTGKLAEAKGYFEQSLTHAEQAGDRAGMARSWDALGSIASKQGDSDLAEALHTKSLLVFTKLGDRARMARSWDALGNIASKRGDDDLAEALYNKSLKVRIDLGDWAGMATSWSAWGNIASKRGDYDLAEALYNKSLEVRIELGDRARITTAWDCLGNIASKRGDYDRAEVLYNKSLEVRTELGDRARMANSWGYLGENELERGNLETAETWLKQALPVFEELQMPGSLAKIHWNLARLDRAKGDELQGQAHYATSHSLYSKLVATKDLERIEREWNGL
jgi:tetratricopeptide (TPR) repeat protein